jgi:hypothetical protein
LITCIASVAIAILVPKIVLSSKKAILNNLYASIGKDTSSSIKQLKDISNETSEKISGIKAVRSTSDIAFFLSTIPKLLPDGVWTESISLDYSTNDAPAVKSTKAKKKSKKKNNTDADIEGDDKIVSEEKENEQKTAKATQIHPNIIMIGYAYSVNRNEQFALANEFLSNLKNKNDFASFFESIDLISTKSQTYAEKDVTGFEIHCK